jgi:mannose-6-phosphate isomerase-like protein (cupin superfamily)
MLRSISPGNYLSYKHDTFKVALYIISGTGTLSLDGNAVNIYENFKIEIPIGVRWSLFNKNDSFPLKFSCIKIHASL